MPTPDIPEYGGSVSMRETRTYHPEGRKEAIRRSVRGLPAPGPNARRIALKMYEEYQRMEAEREPYDWVMTRHGIMKASRRVDEARQGLD